MYRTVIKTGVAELRPFIGVVRLEAPLRNSNTGCFFFVGASANNTYSIPNRRLFVFRVAESLGVLREVHHKRHQCTHRMYTYYHLAFRVFLELLACSLFRFGL